MVNHYDILGIKPDAKPDEVKKSYFKQAKKYHPDKGDETEIGKFHEVTKAYKVLSDRESRKVYDLSLGISVKEAKKAEPEVARQPMRENKRESFRDEELKEFRRNRYKSAVLRVIFTSVFLGVIGGVLGIILDGLWVFGSVSGIFMGFSYSINQNFQVRSFFKSDGAHKLFRVFTWLLFLDGLGYFGWLIVKGLF